MPSPSVPFGADVPVGLGERFAFEQNDASDPPTRMADRDALGVFQSVAIVRDVAPFWRSRFVTRPVRPSDRCADTSRSRVGARGPARLDRAERSMLSALRRSDKREEGHISMIQPTSGME